MVIELAVGLLIATFIFLIRKETLLLAFALITSILFYFTPIYFTANDLDVSKYAAKSVEMVIVFFVGFSLSHIILTRGRFREVQLSIGFADLEYCRIYAPTIILGIFLKLVGGDLIHSSIYTFPWAFPVLYGISDRFFQIGVGLAFLSAMENGLTRRNFVFISSVILLSTLGGSRITIIIPVSLLLMLYLSKSGCLGFVGGGLIGVGAVLLIVGVIGHLRTDETSNDFVGLLDIVLFRISEFYWPTRLAELLDDGSIGFNPGWFFSGLLGILPSAIGQLATGKSVFQRDTDLLIDLEIGSEFMSVPLTVMGEGYYWGGNLGVFLISVLCAFVFFVLRLVLRRTHGMINLIIFVQIYRFVFVLPVASFPELVSLVTKDLLFSYLMAIMVFRVFGRKMAAMHTPAIHT